MKNLYQNFKETTPCCFVMQIYVVFLIYSQQKIDFNIYLSKKWLRKRCRMNIC